MKAAFLAAAVLATAGVVLIFRKTAVHAAKSAGPEICRPGAVLDGAVACRYSSSRTRAQTAPQVKFLAHGAGYGLFLTADEAVLELQPSAVSTQHSARLSAVSCQL